LALVPLAALGWALAQLPLDFRLWVGRRLGDLAHWALWGRRGVARQNLALAFGRERTARELDCLCRQSFRQLGMTLAEACALLFTAPTSVLSRVQVEGMEHLTSAMAQGKGVLILTAHFGNWELLAASHSMTGFPRSVVGRPLDHPFLDRLAVRLRVGSGAEFIDKRRALSEVLSALRRQRMVGIVLDQNASRREGVFVPFFGVPASTSKGLALLALRTGAPVVPVFIHREPGGRHRVIVDPAVPLSPTGDRDRDVVEATAAFTRIIEAKVRQHPEQWFWLHRRWKTRPPQSAPGS
jgi:KDO2-lipid IV(A) lauroyltransferase